MRLVISSSWRTGDVGPGRVLRQSRADRVADGQLALGFELKKDHRGDALVLLPIGQRAAGDSGGPPS